MAPNRVRFPATAVQRIVTWKEHQSSRGWRPLLAIPTVLYSDDAESLVYLVNVEIVVRRPDFAAEDDQWRERAAAEVEPEPVLATGHDAWGESLTGVVEPEPVLAADDDEWGESLTGVVEPEPAMVASGDRSVVGVAETTFASAERRETRQATTWSARALPPRARGDVVESAASSASRRKTLSAPQTLSARTWTAHVPPPQPS